MSGGTDPGGGFSLKWLQRHINRSEHWLKLQSATSKSEFFQTKEQNESTSIETISAIKSRVSGEILRIQD